jgi:uncharacterized protein
VLEWFNIQFYQCDIVTDPRRPFRLNVGFIVHQEVGYRHEFPFEYEQIQIADDLDLHHLQGTVLIGRTPQGLIVRGKFNAQTALECMRCLTSFDNDLHWELTELYAFKGKSDSESGLLLPDDGHIDLGPLIREYALLEFPIKPICKPDCKGLCSECGEDLNRGDCGHRNETKDSPFSSLKDLLNE